MANPGPATPGDARFGGTSGEVPPPEVLQQLLFGWVTGRALQVVVELGVADVLGGAAQTVEDIAAAVAPTRARCIACCARSLAPESFGRSSRLASP